MSGDVVDSNNWRDATGIQWVEASVATKHRSHTGQSPWQMTATVNSAEVEKPWQRGRKSFRLPVSLANSQSKILQRPPDTFPSRAFIWVPGSVMGRKGDITKISSSGPYIYANAHSTHCVHMKKKHTSWSSTILVWAKKGNSGLVKNPVNCQRITTLCSNPSPHCGIWESSSAPLFFFWVICINTFLEKDKTGSDSLTIWRLSQGKLSSVRRNEKWVF